MKYWLVGLVLSVLAFSCKKQSENLGLDTINQLYPLRVGEAFIYRMDSSAPSSGQFYTSYYLAKDSVISTFLDNQGRTSYVIFRYLTDTLNSKPYQYSATMYVSYDQGRIEYVDPNNLRFVVLANPVSYNTTWLGNNYITDTMQQTISQNTSYTGWDYQYLNIDQPYTVMDSTYPKTCTVLQDADSTAPAFVADSMDIYTLTYSAEVYAKGVGLVYKEFRDYCIQNPPPLGSAPYKEDGSFMLKLRLVSYK